MESSIVPIPLEDFDIDYVSFSSSFILPVLFPFSYKKDVDAGLNILYIGKEDERVGELPAGLSSQFPGARVEYGDFQRVLTMTGEEGEYHYIIATSLRNFSSGVSLKDIFTRLQSLLAPGGVVAAAVNGFAGYYGLETAARLVRGFAPDSIDDKTFKKLRQIVSSVIQQLPSDHPAFHRPAFIERLKNGHKETILQLLRLNHDNIYTVSRLLDEIGESGVRFVDWMFPGFYDPARFIDDDSLKKKMRVLPFPQSSMIAEQFNGCPPEHYFFFSRPGDTFFKIPFDSPDISWWRPMRLPFYQYENLSADDAAALEPIPRLSGLFPVPLRPWESRFILSADGTKTVDQLQQTPQNQFSAFLKRAVNNRLIALLPPC